MQAYQVQFRDAKIKTRTGQFLRYLGPDQDQVHFIKTLDRTRPGVLVQDWQDQQKCLISHRTKINTILKMSDQTVTSNKAEIWDWTGPKSVKNLKLQTGSEQGRQKLGSDKGQKFQNLGCIGHGDSLAVRGSLVQITDLLLKEISRRATFSSFHFRLRYNLEVMRLRLFQKFQNFHLQRLTVV